MLGFYCTHAYAHTSNVKPSVASLKGIDMAMFCVLHKLGLKPRFHPTLSLHGGELGDFDEELDETFDVRTFPLEVAFWIVCMTDIGFLEENTSFFVWPVFG